MCFVLARVALACRDHRCLAAELPSPAPTATTGAHPILDLQSSTFWKHFSKERKNEILEDLEDILESLLRSLWFPLELLEKN